GPVAQFAAFAAPTVILEGGNAYIETREALAQQGMEPEDAERLAAQTAALTYAGALLLERIPGAHFVLSRVPGVRTVFQNSFVRRMRERAAGRFISGALAEGATEAAQEAWADAMQYLATRDPATFEQFRERLLAAGTLGAAVGGVAEVVLGAPPVEPAAPRQPEVEAAQAEAQVAAQAQAEAAAQAAAATAAAAEAAQQAAEAAQQAAEQASAAAQQALPAPPPAPEAQASAAEQGPPAPPAEPPAAPAPEAPAAAVVEPEVTDALREAARAWMAGEAYVDSRGNYHVRRPGRTTGPIAPWNREVKRRFPTVDDFRRFAESIIGTSAVEPQAQPEPAPEPAPAPAP